MINKKHDTTEQTTTTNPATSVRREPFTDEQLLTAWKGYIKAHPNEQLVVSAMEASEPKRENDTLYYITVGSQAQLTFMEGSKTAIMNHLRDAVKNDMLALDIRLDESKPEKKIFTPREIVDEIKQHNPKFNSFIKDFNLGLA